GPAMSNQLLDRRDILKWGGTALAAACAGEVIAPPKIKAGGKANPGGTRHTPKDIDIQKFTSDISLSKTLFPRASEYVDKIALVRSMRANELIHFIGQYHTQTGR